MKLRTLKEVLAATRMTPAGLDAIAFALGGADARDTLEHLAHGVEGFTATCLTCRLSDDSEWLELRASAPPAAHLYEPDRLLCLNAGLAAGWRIAVDAAEKLEMSADVRVCGRSIGGTASARERVHRHDVAPGTGAAKLEEAAISSGREHHVRDDGRITFDLDVRGTFRQLEVCEQDGWLHAALALATPAESCTTRHRAAALHLLTATARVRCVRAACNVDDAGNGDGEVGALAGWRLEAALPPAADTLTRLDDAVCCLIVAAQLCAAEAELLATDLAIARAYLERAERTEDASSSARGEPHRSPRGNDLTSGGRLAIEAPEQRSPSPA